MRGHALGDLPGAASKFVLLCTSFYTNQAFKAFPLAQIFEKAQVRDLARFGAEHRAGDGAGEFASAAGVDMFEYPAFQGLRVPLPCFGGEPGLCCDWQAAHFLVPAPLQQGQLHQRQERKFGDVRGEGADVVIQGKDAGPGGVLGQGFDAEGAGLLQQQGLLRAHPLAAQIDGLASDFTGH